MKDYDKEMFSCRLRIARIKRKLKQSELAQTIGVSAATISSYERVLNAKIPSLDNAYKISRYLDVSLDWLCGIDNDATI